MDEIKDWLTSLNGTNVHAVDSACAALPVYHVWEV